MMGDRVMRGGGGGGLFSFQSLFVEKKRRHLEIALIGNALMGNVVVY